MLEVHITYMCSPKVSTDFKDKGLFKKNLLFQNCSCHVYSNGKRSTVPESLIKMAQETVFLLKKFARKRVQEMSEVTLVVRKDC